MDLSIIVPIYNNENYLLNCLQSIIKNMNDKTELILIDDCSTDKSYKIAQEFVVMYKDYNIFLEQNYENLGSGRTKNKGLKLAKGKYIGFVDSDDFVDENFYVNMLEIAKKNNSDIVISDIAIFSNDDIKCSSLYDNNFSGFKETGEFLDHKFVLGNWTAASACNKIFKQEFANKFSFMNNSTDDLTFTIPILSVAKNISYCKNNNYYYRINPASITRTFSIKKMRDKNDTIFKTIEILYDMEKFETLKIFLVLSLFPTIYTSMKTLKINQKKKFLKYFEKKNELLKFSLKKFIKNNYYIVLHDTNSYVKYKNIADFLLIEDYVGLLKGLI